MNLKDVMMDAENDKKTTDQIDEAIETEMNKIKHKVFGKVKSSNKTESSKELKELHLKKESLVKENKVEEIEETNKEIISKVKVLQREKLEKEMQSL